MSWPEPPDWLRLEVEPRRLARGGTVTVAFDAPHDRIAEYPRELGLACLAHHAGRFKTGEVGNPGGRFRVDRQDVVCADWRLLDDAEGEFEFTVPGEGPYSYEGDVVSFYWGVWLRAEARVLDREAYVAVVVDP
ncbi:MAG TPA: hypothetical protein VNO82_08275 [Solirubrobacteraceae bacterium]|nr:hypothetical protein [Solirubrobacteraceae bacterium]